MRYPGGKGSSGTYQTIINQIPPHDLYIEGFLGGGAILRKKRPALINIGNDLDSDLIELWRENPKYQGKQIYTIPEEIIQIQRETGSNLFIFCFMPFLELVARIDAFGYEPHKIFFYLDPPYLLETRRSQRQLYKYEMDRKDHFILIRALLQRRERIMISGYHSPLYDEMLQDWRSLDFTVQTRGGSPATETLWMNYPQPTRLHDYRYLGTDFTDRQRIKRKAQRMRKKILKLPHLERAAILKAIEDIQDFDHE